MRLWTGSDLCLSRFLDYGVSALSDTFEHLSLISILDGKALNWCKQEHLRAQLSETVFFGKIKDPELIVLIFRGQLQCRMGEKRQGPIEAYPKFWNLNPPENQAEEILTKPPWTEAFELIRRELGVILKRDVASRVSHRGANNRGIEQCLADDVCAG